MYLPGHFAIDDDEALAVVDARRAGTLVVGADGGFEASLLPWLLVRDGEQLRLRGHVARANPLARLVSPGSPALVVFDAADGYVSPSWYPSKATDPRVVPTWNYVSVHLHGTVSVVDDPAWLRLFLEALTDVQERDEAEPWSVGDAPDDFVERMIRGVVGLEVTVARVEGKAKLSQNRRAEDAAGVRQALVGRPGSEALLRAMEGVAG